MKPSILVPGKIFLSLVLAFIVWVDEKNQEFDPTRYKWSSGDMEAIAHALATRLMVLIDGGERIEAIKLLFSYKMKDGYEIPRHFPERLVMYLPLIQPSFNLTDCKDWYDLFEMNWKK